MTVTQDGAIVDGQEIKGFVHVKADNVTIRNSTIRYGGDHAIQVFDGSVGTVIEATRVHCEKDQTNGIVFGGYVARRVEVFGCRNGFLYSDESPATIIDSTWNGQPVETAAAVEPTDTPAPASAAPSATKTATPKPSTKAAGADRQRSAGTFDGPSGYPGPDNTGVPSGTTLRPSGSITLAQDGQVVSGLNIKGCVLVTAKNVIIRKSRITCGSPYSIRTKDADNLLVEDVEINGMGKNTAAVCCGEYTLRRVEIFNVLDGPRLGDNTVVEQSWIHDLVRVGSSHNDALQITGGSNVVVRGNSLEVYNSTTRDPLNSCLMIGSTTSPSVSNLVYEQNYCNGGNYSIGIRSDLRATNIAFRNNVFGRNCRYGIIARSQHPGLSWDRATNIWVDSRKPVL
ncbi:right-handed parallel beta-helix repeat-containing protein [Micromonospora sonneratiae]|uniref:Right handed beta helix region n=1 Tax=Micromonospora sonneratiae TaxID=1184706 RepID=A0ABW3YQS3_9ACTN